MKKEQKLEQQPNSDSTADNSQVSPTCPKPIVGRSVFRVKSKFGILGRRICLQKKTWYGWKTVSDNYAEIFYSFYKNDCKEIEGWLWWDYNKKRTSRQRRKQIKEMLNTCGW